MLKLLHADEIDAKTGDMGWNFQRVAPPQCSNVMELWRGECSRNNYIDSKFSGNKFIDLKYSLNK